MARPSKLVNMQRAVEDYIASTGKPYNVLEVVGDAMYDIAEGLDPAWPPDKRGATQLKRLADRLLTLAEVMRAEL